MSEPTDTGGEAVMRERDAMKAENARLRAENMELARIAGGGCDAADGGDHVVIREGKYSFCANCGESLKGVRFCHEPRAALEAKP